MAEKHPADALADIQWNRRGIAWNLEADALLRCIPALEAERDQLRAEVEALRADAERYRWLRDTPCSFTVFAEASACSMDEDVDAARKAAP